MPDVGLTSAAEPLDPSYRVVIKYSVEVEGLPIYQESYDVSKLEEELKRDPEQTKELWFRRLKCAVDSRHQPAFSAVLTSCLHRGLPSK
jgi:hypothetical protein